MEIPQVAPHPRASLLACELNSVDSAKQVTIETACCSHEDNMFFFVPENV